ncbi:MAG: hypothetical protein AAF938_21860 [Myxococcota bacterium]
MRALPCLRWAFLAVALVGSACEKQEIEGPPPADHGPAPDPSDDPLGARLHGYGFERAPAYAPQLSVFRGELRQGQVADHSVVLIGTRCYVVAAVAEEGMADLDVTLIDANGSPLMRDASAEDSAIIGLRSAICPSVPGEYRIRLRARAGGGAYAARLYAQDII